MEKKKCYDYIESEILKLLEESKKKFSSNFSLVELFKTRDRRFSKIIPDRHSTDELMLKYEAEFLVGQTNRINGQNIKFNALKKAGYKKDHHGKYVLDGKGKKLRMFEIFSTEGFFTIDVKKVFRDAQENKHTFYKVSRALPRFEKHYLESFSESDKDDTPTVIRPLAWHFMKEFVDMDGTVYHFGKEVPEMKGALPPTKSKKPNRDQLEKSLIMVMDYVNEKYGNNIEAHTSNGSAIRSHDRYHGKKVEKNINGFWTISEWDSNHLPSEWGTNYIATKAIYKIESYLISSYIEI